MSSVCRPSGAGTLEHTHAHRFTVGYDLSSLTGLGLEVVGILHAAEVLQVAAFLRARLTK